MTKLARFSLAMVLTGCIGGSVVDSFGQSALMTLPGSFEVTEIGAASYTIPIAIPPGTAGIQPALSLTYSSQATNGLLGVGWSLSGLSEIARCPLTLAQDGQRGSVTYEQSDRFCLDGQRLIVITGTYGSAGSEYRTEIETFSEIKASTAMAGSGPASFAVRTKSGLIMEYGTTADSRVEVPGRNEARIWALAKVTDRHGNSMLVSYTEEVGAIRPSRIDYTTNPAGGVANAPTSVRFVYEARPDSSSAGNYRLSRITTYLHAPSDTAVSEYRLTYASGPVTGRSRITQIERCGGTSQACLPATSFGYSDNSPWALSSDITVPLRAADFNVTDAAWANDALYPRILSDVNADGRADIVRFGDNGVMVALSTGNGGFTTPTIWHSGFGNYDGYVTRNANPRFLGDVNGDGLPDLIGFKGGNIFVSLGTGSGFGPTAIWASGVPQWVTSSSNDPTDNMPRIVDVNGDGLTDIVLFGNYITYIYYSSGSNFTGPSSGPPSTTYSVSGVASNGAAGDNQEWCYYSYQWQEKDAPTRLIDFNGDGLPDVSWIGNYLNAGVNLWKGTGSSFYPLVINPINVGGWPCPPDTGGTPDVNNPTIFGDINGDGRTDYAILGSGGVTIGFSNGFGFEGAGNAVPGLSGGNGDYNPQFLIDLNGDGLADIVEFPSGGTVYSFSNGAGYSSAHVWIYQYGMAQGWASSATHPRRLADVNGDGRPDIVGFADAGVFLTPSGSVAFPDLIVSIASGLGASRTIEYRTLSQAPAAGQPALYTKGTGALYPHVDLQVPLPVVRQTAVSNGIGGTTTTRYAYGELRGETTGRGMKGFRWAEALQLETNLRVRTEYSQDFPFTGSPTLVERQLLDSQGQVVRVLSRVEHTYKCFNFSGNTTDDCSTLAGRRYFPYRSRSVEIGQDLNGATLPTVTTTTEYAEPTSAFFGNATKVTVQTSIGSQVWVRETTNTYTNDATNWLLGRLMQSAVQSTTPN